MKPTVAMIIDVVAEHFGTSADEIRGPRRNRVVVRARHTAMLMAYRMRPDMTVAMIAQAFGDRDHCGVLYAIGRHVNPKAGGRIDHDAARRLEQEMLVR